MIKYIAIGGLVYLFLNNYGITLTTTKPVVNEILNLPVQIKLRDLIAGNFKKQNNLINIYISAIKDKNINANLIK